MTEFKSIVTKNPQVQKIIGVAEKISASDIAVLITGESGTGKNLLAQAIHDASHRKAGPFVSVNCSAIPDSLIESELFGYEKGAFTGAVAQRKGKFELSHQGTLFLDEIGDMNISVQSKILQVIETKTFHRVGGEQPIYSDVRIISSTNKDLVQKVQKDEFRMDLYYRIREILLYIPSLRERREDIPVLAEYFLKGFCKDFGKKVKGISDVAMSYLLKHDWPGNIRELRNVIRTAVALNDKDVIWLEDIPLRTEFSPPQEASTEGRETVQLESLSLQEMEKIHIDRVLRYCGWNKSKAAVILKISRPRLHRKIKEYNLREQT
jgi:transcriptional regulator with PAS, ATPase and Fis domain